MFRQLLFLCVKESMWLETRSKTEGNMMRKVALFLVLCPAFMAAQDVVVDSFGTEYLPEPLPPDAVSMAPLIYYEIASKGSDKVLSVSRGSKEDGANVVSWMRLRNGDQRWLLEPTGGKGRFRLKVAHSGLYLAIVEGKSDVPGADVVQSNLEEGAERLVWSLDHDEDGFVRIVNTESGMCLTLSDRGLRSGVKLVQEPKRDTDFQKWSLTLTAINWEHPQLQAPEAKNPLTIEVAKSIQTKREVEGANQYAVEFEAPPGDGRSGARGVLFKTLRRHQGQRTVWSMIYKRGASAFELQLIHPVGKGQGIVHLNSNGIGISSPGAWRESGYGGGDRDAVKYDKEKFQLENDRDYQIRSEVSPTGKGKLFIDDKLVASFQFDEETKPLSLEIPEGESFPGASGWAELRFKGEALPKKWKRGWAGLIVGPRDSHVHECRDVTLTYEDRSLLDDVRWQ
ncbi:MAG: RICIN domain-containing protein [Verrucomicrobiota bacterium]